MRLSHPATFFATAVLAALGANACAPGTPPMSIGAPSPQPQTASSQAASAPAVGNQAGSILSGNPLDELVDMTFTVGEPRDLPTKVGGAGGDWGITPRPPVEITWSIPAEDQARARLDGSRLIPLAPGGLRLIGTSSAGTVWLYNAIQAASNLREYFDPNSPGFPAQRVSPVPLVIQDEATWRRMWVDAYTPSQEMLDQMKAVPTGPPPPPPVPMVDFRRRSLLVAHLDWRHHSRSWGVSPVVTHIEGSVVHVVVPDAWMPEVPSPTPTVAQSGEPTTTPPETEGNVLFNLPKLPDQVEVKQEPFVAPEGR